MLRNVIITQILLRAIMSDRRKKVYTAVLIFAAASITQFIYIHTVHNELNEQIVIKINLTRAYSKCLSG